MSPSRRPVLSGATIRRMLGARWLLIAAVPLAACGGTDDATVAKAPGGGAAAAAKGTPPSEAQSGTPSGTPSGAQSGKPGGAPGGGRGPGGGARAVLAQSDVAVVVRGRLEATTPISGDLRPLEVIVVRNRIEGDIAEVRVREGDRVRAGQVLAVLDAAELEAARRSAEADRASAQVDVSTAQWNAEQAAELFKAGAIAEGDLRTRRQAVEGAQARLAATEARLRTAERDLGGARIVASADGTIERRFVQPGERVPRGAQLFSLVRAEVLELAAAVPARAASTVRPGQVARFTSDGQAFTGRVARVGATIDPASRAVTVYVQVPNAGGALKGNSFATGRIVQRVLEGVLLVPTAAVRQGGDGSPPFVYRIEGDAIGVAQVSLGVVDDQAGIAEVAGGLAAGDRVVVGNVGTLGRGMKVTVLGEKGAGREGAAAPRRGPSS